MPILHIELQQQTLRISLQKAKDIGNLLMSMLGQSDVALHKLDAHGVYDVTPSYWQNRSQQRYLMAMGRTAESGELHIFPYDEQTLQHYMDTRGKWHNEALRHVKIPQEADSFAIVRPVNPTYTDVAGLVIHIALEDVAAAARSRQPQP